ncbi:NAD(P)/FAD-dependent oxidoreductase [Glycomyces buryatensis]|uniref:Ferredoxin--NADP reductase n=1 Tax=Glycomyces buryatensis TaxID=2570927 RepID=A0A4S8Q1T7_9ACTN|nr:NAD(P)/FAD-dependent oxidoreductase [Glycomyces buryatensis]THV37061.1 NAD(P)/FAD-dependent oxidoreductase [Glycomyces buryatensis]
MPVLTVDLAIVGAGPTGLFAAYYAGFRGLSTVVADALPEAGGQITAMYPEKLIYDVAGFPEIRGRDLVDNLVRQAAAFEPSYLLGHRAEKLHYEDGSPLLEFDDGTRVQAKAVLITGGLGSFTSRPLPAAADFTGEGVVYFVPELAAHAGQDVVIVGGGDSAFDWAQALHPIAGSVTIVHRREKFRAHQATVERVRELGVPIIVNAQVRAMRGTDHVTGIEIDIAGDDETRYLPADTVVAALGFTADLGPLTEWGLEIEKRCITVDSTMATNLHRVFAAGDIAQYVGKVRLIATGFGEAATAVNNAAVALDPEAHLFPGHSSENP